MRRSRKTKIVATLGPVSANEERIGALHGAGVDVFRINMSHTSHEELRWLVGAVRRVEAAGLGPIAILVDLQGPKLRLGNFIGGSASLAEDDHVTLVRGEEDGDAATLPVPHPEIFAALKPGDQVLIDDGRVRLTVDSVSERTVAATVRTAGVVKNHKGINLPDSVPAIPALTPKDRADLDYALSQDIDWIALSFVQRPDDVAELRKVVAGRAGVMAKIEKPAALNELERILELTDGVMVARGDLGVEMPIEAVPGKQKQIVRAARRAGKPVVVATQMLESMIHNPMPTRAEASDVATAVFEGADAVMLSAETATGSFSVETVAMMDRIAAAVEADPLYQSIVDAQRVTPEATIPDAITAAVHDVARHISASAIVCWTKSGSTGLRAARERPDAPVIALTPIPTIARRLTLVWGLHCVTTEDAKSLEDVAGRACSIAFTEGFAKAGERIVITAGLPLGTPGATNMLRVAYVGERG